MTPEYPPVRTATGVERETEWGPLMVGPAEFFACPTCGAAVVDVVRHEGWHRTS